MQTQGRNSPILSGAVVRLSFIDLAFIVPHMVNEEVHWNQAPDVPALTGISSRPAESMNWKCHVCSMHYAFAHFVPTPQKCDRCGGKLFRAY